MLIRHCLFPFASEKEIRQKVFSFTKSCYFCIAFEKADVLKRILYSLVAQLVTRPNGFIRAGSGGSERSTNIP